MQTPPNISQRLIGSDVSGSAAPLVLRPSDMKMVVMLLWARLIVSLHMHSPSLHIQKKNPLQQSGNTCVSAQTTNTPQFSISHTIFSRCVLWDSPRSKTHGIKNVNIMVSRLGWIALLSVPIHSHLRGQQFIWQIIIIIII